MARFAIWISAALAAVSVAAALTQPSADATGEAIVAAPVTGPTTTTTATTPPTTATPPPTTVVTAPPTTAAPRPVVTSPVTAAPPTTAPVVYASSGGRESCGWSWDATHFDDGSLNEVTLVLEAPRRPNSPVTMTAKPGASAATSFATTTDAAGDAQMVISLSNDKRDWSLTIGAQFPNTRCDARSFTIAY